MSLDIVALRRMVWKACGMDSDDDPELPREEIDLYLNRAYWEIQDKFPFREKERRATFSTIAGVNRYDIPQPFEALLGLAIEEPDHCKHEQLEQITPETYDDKFVNTEDAYGIPVEYTRENCFVRLWPTPDAAYVITMRRLVTLADIAQSNAVPEIPRVWHEIIGYGALWRAMAESNGDLQRSQYFKAVQASLIRTITPTQAKEERANTQTAGLEVIRNDYGW